MPKNIRAAEIATRELNAPYLSVILEGKCTDAYLSVAGAGTLKFTDRDLKVTDSPVNFVGINTCVPNQYVLASETTPSYRFVELHH